MSPSTSPDEGEYIISWGDTGLVGKCLIEQQYRKGDTKACITLEGDTTFQPIRMQHSAHLIK